MTYGFVSNYTIMIWIILILMYEVASLLPTIICPLIVRYVWCGNRLYEINNEKICVFERVDISSY